jgi:hypothetical protein
MLFSQQPISDKQMNRYTVPKCAHRTQYNRILEHLEFCDMSLRYPEWDQLSSLQNM